jgi:hypothetical protein
MRGERAQRRLLGFIDSRGSIMLGVVMTVFVITVLGLALFATRRYPGIR